MEQEELEYDPCIQIGRFTITKAHDGVWISDTFSHDGGQFTERALEEALAQFYHDNF